jgi:hypothetical protein
MRAHTIDTSRVALIAASRSEYPVVEEQGVSPMSGPVKPPSLFPVKRIREKQKQFYLGIDQIYAIINQEHQIHGFKSWAKTGQEIMIEMLRRSEKKEGKEIKLSHAMNVLYSAETKKLVGGANRNRELVVSQFSLCRYTH